MTFVLIVLISATAISFASWLSGRSPALAGFPVAMPLATLIVLPSAASAATPTSASRLLPLAM